MAKQDKDDVESPQLYTDAYFEHGHWLLKIWQTLAAIIGWICVLVPMVITIFSYYGVETGRVKTFWHYAEGILEIRFLGVILLFLAAVSLIFTVTMTIIQVRKRERIVEQWPTFNPISQKQHETTLNHFMDQRFGEPSFRENVKTYHVTPDKNLDTDEFSRLFEAQRKEQS